MVGSADRKQHRRQDGRTDCDRPVNRSRRAPRNCACQHPTGNGRCAAHGPGEVVDDACSGPEAGGHLSGDRLRERRRQEERQIHSEERERDGCRIGRSGQPPRTHPGRERTPLWRLTRLKKARRVEGEEKQHASQDEAKEWTDDCKPGNASEFVVQLRCRIARCGWNARAGFLEGQASLLTRDRSDTQVWRTLATRPRGARRVLAVLVKYPRPRNQLGVAERHDLLDRELDEHYERLFQH